MNEETNVLEKLSVEGRKTSIEFFEVKTQLSIRKQAFFPVKERTVSERAFSNSNFKPSITFIVYRSCKLYEHESTYNDSVTKSTSINYQILANSYPIVTLFCDLHVFILYSMGCCY